MAQRSVASTQVCAIQETRHSQAHRATWMPCRPPGWARLPRPARRPRRLASAGLPAHLDGADLLEQFQRVQLVPMLDEEAVAHPPDVD